MSLQGFIFLLFINIVLWAVFYLVISLKLEKSASDFREKRLKREMDAMIREFNETAERNITLLDNRITILKKILSLSGNLKNLDINIDDKPASNETTSDHNNPEVSFKAPDAAITEKPQTEKKEPSFPIVKSHSIFEKLTGFINRLPVFQKNKMGIRNAPEDITDLPGNKNVAGSTLEIEPCSGNSVNGMNLPLKSDHPVTESPSSIAQQDEKPIIADEPDSEKQEALSEKKLNNLFQNTADRYSLISDLYMKGYSLELLSRCSGIPIGEITLVLNLNNP